MEVVPLKTAKELIRLHYDGDFCKSYQGDAIGEMAEALDARKDGGENDIPAPYCEQVVEWLRQKHQIVVWVAPFSMSLNRLWWHGFVQHSYDEKGGSWTETANLKASYQAALITAINMALTVLGIKLYA